MLFLKKHVAVSWDFQFPESEGEETSLKKAIQAQDMAAFLAALRLGGQTDEELFAALKDVLRVDGGTCGEAFNCHFARLMIKNKNLQRQVLNNDTYKKQVFEWVKQQFLYTFRLCINHSSCDEKKEDQSSYLASSYYQKIILMLKEVWDDTGFGLELASIKGALREGCCGAVGEFIDCKGLVTQENKYVFERGVISGLQQAAMETCKLIGLDQLLANRAYLLTEEIEGSKKQTLLHVYAGTVMVAELSQMLNLLYLTADRLFELEDGDGLCPWDIACLSENQEMILMFANKYTGQSFSDYAKYEGYCVREVTELFGPSEQGFDSKKLVWDIKSAFIPFWEQDSDGNTVFHILARESTSVKELDLVKYLPVDFRLGTVFKRNNLSRNIFHIIGGKGTFALVDEMWEIKGYFKGTSVDEEIRKAMTISASYSLKEFRNLGFQYPFDLLGVQENPDETYLSLTPTAIAAASVQDKAGVGKLAACGVLMDIQECSIPPVNLAVWSARAITRQEDLSETSIPLLLDNTSLFSRDIWNYSVLQIAVLTGNAVLFAVVLDAYIKKWEDFNREKMGDNKHKLYEDEMIQEAYTLCLEDQALVPKQKEDIQAIFKNKVSGEIMTDEKVAEIENENKEIEEKETEAQRVSLFIEIKGCYLSKFEKGTEKIFKEAYDEFLLKATDVLQQLVNGEFDQACCIELLKKIMSDFNKSLESIENLEEYEQIIMEYDSLCRNNQALLPEGWQEWLSLKKKNLNNLYKEIQGAITANFSS